MENSDGKLVVKATNQKERVCEREKVCGSPMTRMKEKLSTTGHFCRARNSTVVGVRWDSINKSSCAAVFVILFTLKRQPLVSSFVRRRRE